MVDRPDPELPDTEMDESEWQVMRRRSLRHAAELIRRGQTRFFVVGDEEQATEAYEAQLQARGKTAHDTDTRRDWALRLDLVWLDKLVAAA